MHLGLAIADALTKHQWQNLKHEPIDGKTSQCGLMKESRSHSVRKCYRRLPKVALLETACQNNLKTLSQGFLDVIDLNEYLLVLNPSLTTGTKNAWH